MNNIQYNSSNKTKSSKRKTKNPISQLAKDSFDAFKPFINIFDCGVLGAFSVCHLITKEDWVLFRRYKNGERGLKYANGNEFRPQNVVLDIYSPRHVQRHLEGGEVSYYTSGRDGKGLIYLDIDAHHSWQKDEQEAKRILQELFPFGFFRSSNRGQNGYLKVSYVSAIEYNTVVDRLEKKLRTYLLSRGILCDFEIKGSITTDRKSGRLAKLPFNTPYRPCLKRDETDDWTEASLEQFKNCPTINLRRLERMVDELPIDEEKVHQTLAKKEQLEAEEKSIETVQPVKQPTVIAPVVPAVVAIAPSQPKPLVKLRRSRLKSEFSSSEHPDDAFRRNFGDLLPFVRDFYRQERRFPSSEEALNWLHEEGRFSGCWEDNFDRRERRVGQILSFIEQTFDPSLLSSGSSSLSLKSGKYMWWVRQKFGQTLIARISDVDRFDAKTMKAPTSIVKVPAEFVDTFLTVINFCLKDDPLQNQAVPTNRIKKIWNMVRGGSSWNQKYFQVVRNRLHRLGVVSIFDREHHVGKAWKWEVGKNMPTDSWREDQRKLRDEHRLPSELDKSFEDLISNRENEHNTLYQLVGDFSVPSPSNKEVRPPPW